MGVEVVQDKGKTKGSGMGLHQGIDQFQKIGFVARRPAEALHLAVRYVQARQQREGAVAFILKLAPHRLTGLHGVVRSDARQGLNAGHLIQREGQFAPAGGVRGLLIDLADGADFVVLLRVGLGVEPVTAAVGLQVGCGEQAIDVPDGDAGNDGLLDRLVLEFARRPVGDWSAMILRLFTSQGDEGTSLLCGEGVGTARTRGVSQSAQ